MPSECVADANFVIHSATNRRLRFGELAVAAAKLKPPADPPLKQQSEWKLLGRSRGRVELPSKLNGSAVFGLDFRVPGMLHAAVAMPPAAGGKVRRHDRTPAVSMPGVVDVVELPDGIAVVADTYWRARKALAAIPIEWDPGPNATVDSAEIMSQYKRAREGNEWIRVIGPEDQNGYLQRYLLSSDFHLGVRFRFFSELQSGLEDGRNGGPRPTDLDRLDLHQAFLDWRISGSESESVTLRVGRQEVAFRSGRLIAPAEGLNLRRSMDAARISIKKSKVDFNATALRLVLSKPGIFDNIPDHTQTFWGAGFIVPRPFWKVANIGVYYLGFDNRKSIFAKGIGREIRQTFGAHIWRHADLGITTMRVCSSRDLSAARRFDLGLSPRTADTLSLMLRSVPESASGRTPPVAIEGRGIARWARSIRYSRRCRCGRALQRYSAEST